MKIFESIQKYFAFVGINSHQSLRNHPFNARNLTTIFIFALSIFSNLVHFFCVANSFSEYTSSIIHISTILVSAINFTIFIYKMPELFGIIKSFEEIINKSEQIVAFDYCYVTDDFLNLFLVQHSRNVVFKTERNL